MLRGLYRRIAEDIALASQPDGPVLDVGTGPGMLLAEIARARPDQHVTGIGLSADMVAATEGNTRDFARLMRAQAGDVTGLPPASVRTNREHAAWWEPLPRPPGPPIATAGDRAGMLWTGGGTLPAEYLRRSAGRAPSPHGVRISPFGAALSGYMPARASPWPRPIPDPRLMPVAGDQGRTGDLPDVLARVAEPR